MQLELHALGMCLYFVVPCIDVIDGPSKWLNCFWCSVCLKKDLFDRSLECLLAVLLLFLCS